MHPVTPEVCPLQPPKAEVALGVAVKVPTSLLPRDTVHVALQLVLLPGLVVSLKATVPPPAPAKVIVMFFAAGS